MYNGHYISLLKCVFYLAFKSQGLNGFKNSFISFLGVSMVQWIINSERNFKMVYIRYILLHKSDAWRRAYNHIILTLLWHDDKENIFWI